MSLPSPLAPSLVEVHRRTSVVAVAAAGPSQVDGGRSWVAGDLVPVAAGAEALGEAVWALLAVGGQPSGPRSAAAANGSWCEAFGVETVLEVIEGLQTIVIVAGPGGVGLEPIDADGSPTERSELVPATLDTADALGEALLAALDAAPHQRSLGN